MERRNIMITGAARGLGHAMAEALTGAGHNVLAIDRDAFSAETIKAGLGKIETLAIDLTHPDAAARAMEACASSFGHVDVLINCAGIGQETISQDFVTDPVKFWTVKDEDWDRIFAVNVRSSFRLCRAVTPSMIKARWGRIINVTTSLETMIRPGMAPYGPSKAAFEALTAIIAKDLEGTGVTANVLVPGGPANTRMMPNIPGPQRALLVQPDLMRAPIVWLVSGESGNINGMRFRANAWDAAKPGHEAAALAGAPAAWSGIAGGAAAVAGR